MKAILELFYPTPKPTPEEWADYGVELLRWHMGDRDTEPEAPRCPKGD